VVADQQFQQGGAQKKHPQARLRKKTAARNSLEMPHATP
jgi:transcription initiation factor TFIID subunit TAF12